MEKHHFLFGLLSFMLCLVSSASVLPQDAKELFMSKNIDYYNDHAQAFHDRTAKTDLTFMYKEFLQHLPKSASILDAGCGVGRDSKYFLDHGYKVTAFDASHEMAEMASKAIGRPVLEMTFQQLNFENEFEGVWAQLSLIHVPYEETREVYEKIHRALKAGGIFSGSYKYGRALMSTAERDFWNMDEERLLGYIEGLFDPIHIWTEEDTRSQKNPSTEKKILNFILRKK